MNPLCKQNGIVCLELMEKPEYPSNKYNFSPDKRYPEYPFSDISDERNEAYEIIRNSLID